MCELNRSSVCSRIAGFCPQCRNSRRFPFIDYGDDAIPDGVRQSCSLSVIEIIWGWCAGKLKKDLILLIRKAAPGKSGLR